VEKGGDPCRSDAMSKVLSDFLFLQEPSFILGFFAHHMSRPLARLLLVIVPRIFRRRLFTYSLSATSIGPLVAEEVCTCQAESMHGLFFHLTYHKYSGSHSFKYIFTYLEEIVLASRDIVDYGREEPVSKWGSTIESR